MSSSDEINSQEETVNLINKCVGYIYLMVSTPCPKNGLWGIKNCLQLSLSNEMTFFVLSSKRIPDIPGSVIGWKDCRKDLDIPHC